MAWSRDAPAGKGSTTRRDTIPPIAPRAPTLSRSIILSGTDDGYVVAHIAEHGYDGDKYVSTDKTLIFSNAYDLSVAVFDFLVDGKGKGL